MPLAVTIGGAPLTQIAASRLDASRIRVEGTVSANVGGRPLDLVVRTPDGSAVAPGAMTLAAPELSYEEPFIVFRGRPGDSCRLQLSTHKAPTPIWSRHGACWLEGDTYQDVSGWLIANENGSARRDVSAYDLGSTGRVWVQGLARPAKPTNHGVPSQTIRWTNVCEITRGP